MTSAYSMVEMMREKWEERPTRSRVAKVVTVHDDLLTHTANVSGHFMVGLHFERWETMDKDHIVTIAQFA